MAARNAASIDGPAQPMSLGSELGDLTRSLDTLATNAGDLLAAYEADETAYALAARAGHIRDRASRLETTLNEIGTALQNLEV